MALFQVTFRSKALNHDTSVNVIIPEGPGIHNWAFWDEWVKNAIKWMLEGR